MERTIVWGDNLEFLGRQPDGRVNLIYIDPPFNTGQDRIRVNSSAVRDKDGDRVGFMGRRYRLEESSRLSYPDNFDSFMEFLEPRLVEAVRVLAPDGSLLVHLDYREVHYCKVFLDTLMGRNHFMNEIIWAYDYGSRSRSRWSTKHDSILWYVKDPRNYTFRYEDIDRIPYMAPKLVGKEKAERGKTPTDVWWNTIVSPTGQEKTGYPTQKPLKILERIVKVHSNPGDLVLDFFAGSGTTGAACARNDRSFLLVDNRREAVEVMKNRLEMFAPALVDVTGSPLSL